MAGQRWLIGTVAILLMTVMSGVAASPALAATGQLVLARQAMGGDLRISPGAILRVGYTLNVPGAHPAMKVAVTDAQVDFSASCPSGASVGLLSVRMAEGLYTIDSGVSSWIPSDDQNSMLTYQGTTPVPDLCFGAAVSLRLGGVFSATVASSAPSFPIQLRWHYSTPGGPAGGWSGTASVRAIAGPGAPSPPATSPSATGGQLVVKIDRSRYTVQQLTNDFSLALDDGGLASRGVYLLHSTDPTRHRTLRPSMTSPTRSRVGPASSTPSRISTYNLWIPSCTPGPLVCL